MAAAVYYSWDRAGRPVVPAAPIRDYVTRLKVAFPRGAAANLFGWYANEAHYQANPPQDHTPFSATGWPLESPHWIVFATDVMHRPDLGVDCNVLFAYWLAEARAGRTPWVKYLIWQGKLYDVRNQWRPQANSGHDDHIHISVRTDWQNKGLGTWSLLPQEDDMAMNQADADALIWRVEAMLNNRPLVINGPTKGEVNQLHIALREAVGDPITDEQLAALAKELAEAIDVPTTDEIADAVNDDAAARLQD